MPISDPELALAWAVSRIISLFFIIAVFACLLWDYRFAFDVWRAYVGSSLHLWQLFSESFNCIIKHLLSDWRHLALVFSSSTDFIIWVYLFTNWILCYLLLLIAAWLLRDSVSNSLLSVSFSPYPSLYTLSLNSFHFSISQSSSTASLLSFYFPVNALFAIAKIAEIRLLRSYVDLEAEMAALWCLSMSWLLSSRVFWYRRSLSSYCRMIFSESPSKTLVSISTDIYFSRIVFLPPRFLFTICFRVYFLKEEWLVLFYFWFGLG
jgi:hypothetical protein